MAPQLPEGNATLDAGDHCPLCNAGALFRIAENANGWLLKCFNCDRSASVHVDTGYKVQADKDEAAGGFTQTAEQLAAKGELDTEQAVARARTAEAAPAAPHPNAGGLETPPPDSAGTGEDV